MPEGETVREAGARRGVRSWLALAVTVHLGLVASIALQPLDVNSAPARARTPLWPLFHDAVHRIGPGADFFALYHAGVALEQGRSPYEDPEEPLRTPYFYPYRYLPGLAETAGRAAALFPPRAAYLLWIAALEGLLALLLAALRPRGPVIPALLLLSAPFFLEVHCGQFTFVACATTALAILALERGRRGRVAAAWLAGATFLKIFPAIGVAALLRDRAGRRAAAGALLALAAGATPFFLAGGAADWAAFLQANAAPGLAGMDAGNHGLLRAVFLLTEDLGARWSAPAWDLAAGAARAAVLLAVAAVALRGGGTVADRVAALLLAHFLTYPQVWEHHYSGVLVIAALVLRGLEGGGGTVGERRWGYGAAAWLALPTPFVLLDAARDPAIWDPSAAWPRWAVYVPALWKALPSLALFLLALRRARARQSQRSAWNSRK